METCPDRSGPKNLQGGLHAFGPQCPGPGRCCGSLFRSPRLGLYQPAYLPPCLEATSPAQGVAPPASGIRRPQAGLFPAVATETRVIGYLPS